MKRHIFRALVLSLCMVIGTLFIPQTVYTVEEENNITFGYPYPFVILDSSYDIVETNNTPATYSILSFREHPHRSVFDNFLASWALMFVLVEILPLLARKVTM